MNEIAKEKVFYTTFVVLILSSFMLQTGKADEVQVKSDEAKIDYVNSEAQAEPPSQVSSVVTSTSLMVFSSSETDEALLEVHSQVDIIETSVSMAKPHSEEARVQALGEDRSVAGSERGDSSPISEVA